ncbi:unnamed protein product [Aphis gossypii]|uniref:THAP-type domain-containing protein n=1 Tax=Aphis gossypii TaxID=80765 RepID=A0A9P0NDE2_APHGO|nr:unnamed protein product [Aphis gossypii]
MVLVCLVKNCKNAKSTTKEKSCNLFRIPKGLARSEEWLINCEREDLISKSVDNLYNNYRVCMNHFKNNMFSNPEKIRLLISAVPTEFVMQTTTYTSSGTSPIVNHTMDFNSPSTSMSISTTTLDEQVDKPSSKPVSTQITKDLTLNTPRKSKLKGKLSELNKRCTILEKEIETLTKQMNETY